MDPTVTKPDLEHPLTGRLAAFLKERQVTESADLLLLTASVLHAFSARRFRWVDHWEVSPGGWLPLPLHKGSTKTDREPVGDLLEALESDAWSSVAKARTFSVRISDLQGNRADLVVRRIHRHRHAMSIDLWGHWTKTTLNQLTGSLSSRVPGVRTNLTKYQYE